MGAGIKICFSGNSESSLASYKNALSESHFSIFTLPLNKEIVKKIRKKTPHVLFLDLTLPKMIDLQLIKRIKDLEEDIVVILMVPYELKKKAMESIILGADNYLIKPVEPEEIKIILGRVLRNIALREEIKKYNAQKHKDLKAVNDLVENSQLKDIYREASSLIKNRKKAFVIIGENGTGKEMLAKTIYSLSSEPYAYSPLLLYNCNGIHSKISSSDYKLVDRNTLVKWLQGEESLNVSAFPQGVLWFKDINKIDESLQAKLRQYLSHNLRRSKGKKTDNGYTLLFTSCDDLAPLVEAKKFHKGLYKLLQNHILRIPPLRKRIQDIIPLSLYFLDMFNEEYNREIEGIDPEAQKFLKSYNWPGNVSELKNVIEHAVLTCRKNTLNRDDLELNITGRSVTLETLLNQNEFLPLDEMEKLYIHTILRKVKGNKSKAAKILRISRNTLKSKC